MKNRVFNFQALLVCIILFSISVASAQVGINTTSPKEGAILDASSTNKGIYIPSVNIIDLNTIDPITDVTDATTAESLMVYNINTTTGKGFYYWDGARWSSFSAPKKVERLAKVHITDQSYHKIFEDAYVTLYCSRYSTAAYIYLQPKAVSKGNWNYYSRLTSNTAGQVSCSDTKEKYKVSDDFYAQYSGPSERPPITVINKEETLEFPSYRVSPHLHSEYSKTNGYVSIIIEAYYP